MLFRQLTKFSSFFYRKCLEFGKLVLKSDLLPNSWSKISEVYESTNRNQDSSLKIKIYPETKYTTVVFDAPLLRTNYPSDSASTTLSGTPDQNPFHFLYLEKIPSFSIHAPAYQLFDSAKNDLIHLKSEVIFNPVLTIFDYLLTSQQFYMKTL